MKTLKLSALSLLTALTSLPAAIWAHGDEAINPNMHVEQPIEAQETGFGRQEKTKEVTQTIDITLSDTMQFSPSSFNVTQGETVRLHIKNNGKIPHEFVLGTAAEITEHAEMMKKNPEMEHADASAARVAAGKSADILWQFTQAGTFLYACLILGHWDAGMQGTVTVAGSPTRATNAALLPAPMAIQTIPTTSLQNTAADDHFTFGEIRKVDIAQGKLTIKHGDIKNLEMPGITMVFRVQNKTMMQNIKSGDAVKFVVEKQNGYLMITELQKAF